MMFPNFNYIHLEKGYQMPQSKQDLYTFLIITLKVKHFIDILFQLEFYIFERVEKKLIYICKVLRKM